MKNVSVRVYKPALYHKLISQLSCLYCLKMIIPFFFFNFCKSCIRNYELTFGLTVFFGSLGINFVLHYDVPDMF